MAEIGHDNKEMHQLFTSGLCGIVMAAAPTTTYVSIYSDTDCGALIANDPGHMDV